MVWMLIPAPDLGLPPFDASSVSGTAKERVTVCWSTACSTERF